MRICWPTAAIVALILAPTSAAYAQEPARPGEQQETSSTDEGFVQKLRGMADRWQIVERLSGDVDGWYPRLGGMTRGSGFAIGPGYRTHLFDNRILVDASTALSIKGYKAVDTNVRWLQALGERVEVWTDFRYQDFPQEDFFGRGMSSSLDTRTSYDFDSVDFTVRGLVRPRPWLRFGTSVGYMSPDVGPGTDRNFPSIEALFDDDRAPGLVEQPDFLHTTFSGEVDYRDVRGNPTRGGVYRAEFGIWDDRTLQRYDHRRFDALATQYIPLVPGGKHVLSGRLGLSYVNNEIGERVPFYFLGYVGGVDTIRSYREFRFKDENAVWLGAEYKWSAFEHVSLIGFIDAGEVNADWNDIDFRGLKKGYGFGFRVHTSKQTFARLDFGTGGGEGWQVFLKVGPSF